jgi:2-dehydro-3-deoxyphosphogluconate aldolase/(4S)-4-hydroxy-2-oxoglutarate aldolase
MTAELRAVLSRCPVVPVLTIADARTAVPLAQALIAGGLSVLEVTLRTRAGLDSIRRIVAEVPSAIVGAGTVTGPRSLAEAVDAGAQFLVSPGTTGALLEAARDCPVPLLPGAGSVSEVLRLLEEGYMVQKLFPAGPLGGPAYLKAIHGPVPDVAFCPTGGVGPDNAASYLALPNVVCVGGSWPAPEGRIAEGNWAAITTLARGATQLPRGAAATRRGT